MFRELKISNAAGMIDTKILEEVLKVDSELSNEVTRNIVSQPDHFFLYLYVIMKTIPL